MLFKLVLTSDDHVGVHHNIRIDCVQPVILGGCEDDEAAVLLTAPDIDTLRATLKRVRCLNCDCVLLEDEDFGIEPVEVESWR